MGKLENSTLYRKINRKALTFNAESISKVSNTNLEKKPGDVITNKINIAGLESEKSAAVKMAVLMGMIYNLKRELLCKINDRYEVICHASSFAAGVWSAINGVSTVVPFNTLVYTPSDGSFSLGEFTAGKAGYYDVDVYLFNRLLTNPPGAIVWLQISGSLDIYDCDSAQINTERFYLQGSRKVWCAKGGKIYAAVRHDQVTPIDINSVAAPGADGYISISYAGTGRAANHS